MRGSITLGELVGKLTMLEVRMIAVSTVIAGCCTLPANAQISHPTDNEPFEILSNDDSCVEFLAAGPEHQLLDVEWILGYISGANSRGRTKDDRAVGTSLIDNPGVTAWVQKYCRQHDLDPMPAAAEAFRDELARRERRQ
jgi:hypothetical protein